MWKCEDVEMRQYVNVPDVDVLITLNLLRKRLSKCYTIIKRDMQSKEF